MSRRDIRLVVEADELIAASRDLVQKTAEQAERLQANLLGFRVLEFQRQLILGRIRRTLEGATPPAERAGVYDAAMTVPASTTVH
jgi:hypothetical protein